MINVFVYIIYEVDRGNLHEYREILHDSYLLEKYKFQSFNFADINA